MPPTLEKITASAPANPPPATSADLSTPERNSLLKLVIGMTIRGYSYDPKALKSPTATEIATDLTELGIGLDADTVRKYLREGAEFLPGSSLSGKTEKR